MNIKSLVIEAHENAFKHGFWEDVKDLAILNSRFNTKNVSFDVNALSTRLMLIVGEVAEAQEGLRHDDRDNFREELADICIRVFDLCGGLSIDLENEIKNKMAINKERPYKHNKLF